MFFATALLYPCVLAALCLGAGLAVDGAGGRWLPGSLLVAVGAAALIALSQLSTYVPGLAPTTPYLMVAVALAGVLSARGRLAALLARVRANGWLAAAAVLAYALALAPVLVAGRTSFSSYMALADSALHMLGADYLLRHGQHYAHLDLQNSYGQFVNNYYNRSSYPSGADTLFGGSSFLLGLPLIWSFQPFNAFMLAAAVGPAWLLARRLGLRGALAALAALTAVLPALVYAYALFASVKEIGSLSMILTLGCLVAVHERWLGGRPRAALAFALVTAAGTSALGVAFGAWALAAALVLAVLLAQGLRQARIKIRATAAMLGVALAALLVAAWPTWSHFTGSLQVAQAIASTAKQGNLSAPLPASRVLGVWLNDSYKLAPIGVALTLTHVLMAVTLAAIVLGAVHLLWRVRGYALAGWFALTLLAWLAVSEWVTTWAGAKTLMLSSPVVVLLAWGGVAALRRLRVRVLAVGCSATLALALAGGVLASDALQYRASNLAPTRRYEELASLDARFAGQGPTLLTDFDEYALYELRDLDVGGPDFVYYPGTVRAAASGYGQPVDLERVAPSALAEYRLIVTRRDPSANRPPAAYRLVWRGSYYEVWRRGARATVALRHVALSSRPAAQCARIGRLAASPRALGRQLVVAQRTQLIHILLARRARPKGWGRERYGLAMQQPGTLTTTVRVPTAGIWDVWVQGEIMPTVSLAMDGRPLARIGGELDGNSLVANTVAPIAVALSAGTHRLTVTRGGFSLRPGDDGTAVLDDIFLSRAAAPEVTLRRVASADWRALCGRSYEWVELVA